MSATRGAAYILVGCVLNVVTLELIMTRDKGAGHLITLTQFLAVALSTVSSVWIFPFGGFQPRKTPLSYYALLTAVFWASSVTNNKALQYDISVPLHTIFRSSTLVASLLLGMAFFRKRYPVGKILSSLVVTLGVCVATLAEADARGRGEGGGKGGVAASECCGGAAVPSDAGTAAAAAPPPSQWAFGILLVSIALALTALLGHLQEKAYLTYGKDSWQENMFYSHFLALPGFLFVLPDIYEHAALWWNGAFPPVTLSLSLPPALAGPAAASQPLFSLSLPLVALLLANGLLQVICIRGVFMLTSSTSTLTCTLVMTLRKFISLILSVAYFGNPFTLAHWAGTGLVFLGLFLDKFGPGSSKPKPKQS